MSEQLNPILTLTLKKAIKDSAEKSARPNVQPGSYNINNIFSFEGILSVGEDTEVRPTSYLWSKETLILILQRSGIQRERMLSILEEVASSVIENIKQGAEGSVGNELSAITKDVENISNKFEQMLERLPKVPRRGAVSFKGKITEIPRTGV